MDVFIQFIKSFWAWLSSGVLLTGIWWCIKWKINRNEQLEPELRKEVYEPLYDNLNVVRECLKRANRLSNIKYFMDFHSQSEYDRLTKNVKKQFLVFYNILDWIRENGQTINEEVEKVVKDTKNRLIVGKRTQKASPRTIGMNWVDVVKDTGALQEHDIEEIDVRINISETTSTEEKKFYRDNLKTTMTDTLRALKSNLLSNLLIKNYLDRHERCLKLCDELIEQCRKRKLKPFNIIELILN